MVEREKVIKAFEICYTLEHNCTECPLFTEDDCNDKLMHDVLVLLKEQEPVKPIWINTNYERSCKCGKCGALINTFFKYCHECGRAVKWE